jgi:hypothetical protein
LTFKPNEALQMNDYDAILARVILEAENDPARMREIVYEAARLTLRRQINLHKPPLSSSESKRKQIELDGAIARVESGILSAGRSSEPQNAATAADSGSLSLEQDRPVSNERAQSGMTPIRQFVHVSLPIEELPCSLARAAEQYDAPNQIDESHRAQTGEAAHSDDSIPQRGGPQILDTRPSDHAAAVLDVPRAAIVANAQQWSMQQDNAAPHFGENPVQQIARICLPREESAPTPTRTADDEILPRPEQSRRAYPGQAEPSDDSIHRLARTRVPRAQAPKHEVGAREVVLVPKRVRHPKPLTHHTDLVISDKGYRLPPAPRARTHLVISALAVSQLAIGVIAIAAFLMSLWAHNYVAQNGERSPVALETSTASLATLVPTPLPFPRPTVYGVYAVDENQLMALEQIQGTPVDPRTPKQLTITQPGRTVISGPTPKFIVYRRGLASSAPDNVRVRVAARIAHSMIFDSNGKSVITTPETTTWLIRNDQGYELRVAPVPDNAEMIELRSENPDFSYPPGRYELMLGEQAFDFVIAGEVLEPAHCVEGVATGRGPIFYECKFAQRPTPLTPRPSPS